jgi:hypothetical protein
MRTECIHTHPSTTLVQEGMETNEGCVIEHVKKQFDCVLQVPSLLHKRRALYPFSAAWWEEEEETEGNRSVHTQSY